MDEAAMMTLLLLPQVVLLRAMFGAKL